jgi:hypothetical protein
MDTQVRLGEGRKGKDRKGKDKEKKLTVSPKGENKSIMIKHYEGLLKEYDIKYIPAKYEYVNFYKQFKQYEKIGATIADVTKAMSLWFEHEIGQWCGYKLSNFWMDIGKIQLAGKPAITKDERVFKRMQEEARREQGKV